MYKIKLPELSPSTGIVSKLCYNISTSVFGGKAFGLSRVAAVLEPYTPRTTCVSTGWFDQGIMLGHITDDVIWNNALSHIRDSIVVPNELLNELVTGMPDTLYAVRSSATLEDQKGGSMAGQFKSIIGVRRDDIGGAIKKVWGSVFTPRVAKYLKHGDVNIWPKMGVVVQEMVDCSYSGVAFSRNPVGKRDEYVIEYVRGLCIPVVDGSVTPSLIIARHGGLITTVMQRRQTEYAYIDGNAVRRVACDFSTSLTKAQIFTIERALLLLEAVYKSAVDIEWGFSKSGEFKILQCRPLYIQNDAGASISGVSGGIGEGVGSSSARDEDYVLLAAMTLPNDVPAMMTAKAVVTEVGGLTCHAAIVCRELKIPCVVGYDGALKLEGKRLRVDGTNGTVKVITESHDKP